MAPLSTLRTKTSPITSLSSVLLPHLGLLPAPQLEATTLLNLVCGIPFFLDKRVHGCAEAHYVCSTYA